MNHKEKIAETIETKVGVKEYSGKYETTNPKKAKSYCIKCKTLYTVKPYLCKCCSNVFLRGVKQ